METDAEYQQAFVKNILKIVWKTKISKSVATIYFD